MTGRDFRQYVEDIAKYMNYALQFVEDMDFEKFASDPKTVIAVTKCIEVVGEAAKHIPDALRIKYPDIPWREMAGMRDRLVHGYFTVELEIVWQTVIDEFPQILPLMEKALIDMDN
ncbi:MAG TPA: DUF86 domain-containing protein [Methanothrix sp.]|nr:DUF86 domain-containing protein [Methanothrix sp.]HRS85915.1 DUF86 domain-containing protein [Methanothrix sp.]